MFRKYLDLYSEAVDDTGFCSGMPVDENWYKQPTSIKVDDYATFRKDIHAGKNSHRKSDIIASETIGKYVDWNNINGDNYAKAASAVCSSKYPGQYPFESAIRDEVLFQLAVENAGKQGLPTPNPKKRYNPNERDDWFRSAMQNEAFKECIPDADTIHAHMLVARDNIVNDTSREAPMNTDKLYGYIKSSVSKAHSYIVDNNIDCSKIVDDFKTQVSSAAHRDRHDFLSMRQTVFDSPAVEDYVLHKYVCDKYKDVRLAFLDPGAPDREKMINFMEDDELLSEYCDAVRKSDYSGLTIDDIEVTFDNWNAMAKEEMSDNRRDYVSEDMQKSRDILLYLGHQVIDEYSAECDKLSESIDWKNVSDRDYIAAVGASMPFGAYSRSFGFLPADTDRFTISVYNEASSVFKYSDAEAMWDRIWAVKNDVMSDRPNPNDTDELLDRIHTVMNMQQSDFEHKLTQDFLSRKFDVSDQAYMTSSKKPSHNVPKSECKLSAGVYVNSDGPEDSDRSVSDD